MKDKSDYYIYKDNSISNVVYEMLPNGAEFDPPITLTYNYDDSIQICTFLSGYYQGEFTSPNYLILSVLADCLCIRQCMILLNCDGNTISSLSIKANYYTNFRPHQPYMSSVINSVCSKSHSLSLYNHTPSCPASIAMKKHLVDTKHAKLQFTWWINLVWWPDYLISTNSDSSTLIYWFGTRQQEESIEK